MAKARGGGGGAGRAGLKLSEEERSGLRGAWTSGSMEEGRAPQAVGKLFSSKPGDADGMALALGKTWCPRTGVRCKDLGGNLFLFSFPQPDGKRRATTEGPWEFGGDLLVVVDFDGSKRLKELEFTHTPVWIRVLDLPLGLMNVETGRRIGDKVGKTLQVDADEDGSAVGSYLRIRVLLDVRKPLFRGIMMEEEEEGMQFWCDFQYESIPNFCYTCGMLGHVEKECDQITKGGAKQYGKWLRVMPGSKKSGSDWRSGLTEHHRTMVPPSPFSAQELIDDAVAEILLRVPPDEAADLMRASLVCKLWRRVLTDAAFLRRYREFHRTPPLLGFFHNHPPEDVGPMPRFVSTTGASPLPQPDFDGEEWWAVNSHHGRVLVDVGHSDDGLIVWDPITGDKQRVHLPDALPRQSFCLAVLCAVRSCNHLNCHGGPFLVVCVGLGGVDRVIQVFVYSSEAGAWTQQASIDSGGVNYMGVQNGTLIGDDIYFTLGWGDGILKYEIGLNRLSIFSPPEVYDRGSFLVQMEDGSLGLTGSKGSSIYLWSRKETHDRAAGWVQCRVIDFEKLLPSSKLFDIADVNGFAEGVGVMFVGTFAGVFTIEIKSGKLKRIGEPGVFYPIVPFMSFYTPDCTSSILALQAQTS